MPDPLYAIDTAAATLVELPSVPVPVPNHIVYSFSPGTAPNTNVLWHPFQNLTGIELAILRIGTSAVSQQSTSGSITLDVQVDSTSILSSGTPTTLTIPHAGAFYGFVQGPTWEADSEDPPLLAAGSALQVLVTANTTSFAGPCVDVFMIPSSQLSLLES